MKKFIQMMFAVLFAFLIPSFANAANSVTINTSSLSAEQIAQLQQIADQAKPAAQTPAPKVAKKGVLDQVEEISRIVSTGLAATARELGIAVNEFARSPVGQILTVVLVWKYMGGAIVGFVVGIPLLIGGVYFGWSIVKRASADHYDYTYEYKPVLWGLYNHKVVTSSTFNPKKSLSDEAVFMQFAGYVIMIVSFISGLIIIF